MTKSIREIAELPDTTVEQVLRERGRFILDNAIPCQTYLIYRKSLEANNDKAFSAVGRYASLPQTYRKPTANTSMAWVTHLHISPPLFMCSFGLIKQSAVQSLRSFPPKICDFVLPLRVVAALKINSLERF